jgi:hypothetical protein
MGLLLVKGLPAMASETTSKNEWQFDGTVYVWLPTIKSDVSSGGEIDLSINEIVDNLNFAFMGLLGARKDKLRLYVDFIYMDVEDSSINPSYSPRVDIGIQMKALVIQPTAAYTVHQKPDYSIELIGGARYLRLENDVDVEIDILPGGPSGSGEDNASIWTGIVGVQGNMVLSKKWAALAYIDYGTGDADYTYQALAGFNYKFDSVTGVFG